MSHQQKLATLGLERALPFEAFLDQDEAGQFIDPPSGKGVLALAINGRQMSMTNPSALMTTGTNEILAVTPGLIPYTLQFGYGIARIILPVSVSPLWSGK